MEIHYELYVKQNNRWILEAHFQSHQREEAVDDAKQMAKQPHIESVKVVREQRNPATGLNRETTIYSSEITKGQKTGRKDPGADDFGGFDDDFDGDDDYGGFDDGGGDDDYGGGGGGDWDDFEVDTGGGWGDYDGDDEGASGGTGTRAAARTVQNAVSGPEAVVLTKILVIVTASLAFAAIVTWMVQRGGF
jgi:hypothetical protein